VHPSSRTHNAARAEYDRTGGIGLGAEPSNPRQEYARTDRAAVHAINWNAIALPSAIVRDLAVETPHPECNASKQGGEDALVHNVCIVFPFRRERTRQ
jgi:hypothetical protein